MTEPSERRTDAEAEDTAVPDNPLGMAERTPPGADPYDEPPMMAPGDDRQAPPDSEAGAEPPD